MVDLVMELKKTIPFREGEPPGIYSVFVKAPEGENYLIENEMKAFVVFEILQQNNEEQKEKIFLKNFELKEREELVIGNVEPYLLGEIKVDGQILQTSAYLYNCRKLNNVD